MFGKMLVYFGVLLSLAFLISGCERAQLRERTKMGIRVPSAKEFEVLKAKNKIQLFSTVDPTLLCYYANVTGPDIPNTVTACLPDRGVFGGGVAVGEIIELEVPVGKDRIVQLFGFLRKAASDACPSFDNVPGPTSDLLYDLGKSDPVNVAPPVTEVAVTMLLPPSTENLRTRNAWNSCPQTEPAGPPTQTPGRTSAGAGNLQGTIYKMKGRVSLSGEVPVLSGANFKIKSGVVR